MKWKLVAVIAAPLALPISTALADTFLFGSSGVGCGVLCGVQTLTLNGSTVLQSTDAGWYADFSGGQHGGANKNYIVANKQGAFLFNDFFVFDLSQVTGPITSATVSLYNPTGGYVGSGGDVYSMWDVTTPISTLEPSNSGAIALSILNDLGSGTFYGSVTTVADEDNTQINISLNANALADLTAAEGHDFAIGGSLNASAVPGPAVGTGIPGLIAISAGLLGWWQRKRKAAMAARGLYRAVSIY